MCQALMDYSIPMGFSFSFRYLTKCKHTIIQGLRMEIWLWKWGWVAESIYKLVLECKDTTYSLLPLPSMGSYKNKSKGSQPRWIGRPRKAKGKGKPAIDPPVPLPKSHPKPRLKGRSVPLEPHVLSAENESDAILAAMEGLLGLSKAGKTCASD